jgi:photosystem II stability/assembly factor-like uncharacterized protein
MCAWKSYPIPDMPSPVLALAGGQNVLWAGGAGGVARSDAALSKDSGWHLCDGLPLSSCTALAFASGCLLAGGAEGLARSSDNGLTWERSTITDVFHPVMVLAVSSDFHLDSTALAGTLGGGVLRTDDAGKNWKYTNFGLTNLQVLWLAWGEGDTVLAGTEDGIFCSTNGGRAWRPAAGAEEMAIIGLAFLPEETVLAVSEDGRLLRSTNGGTRWAAVDAVGLPEGVEVHSIVYAPWGAVLLSVSGHGVYQSTNGANNWQPLLEEDALILAVIEDQAYAGLERGLALVRADGAEMLTAPPLHDLRNLMIYRHAPLLVGLHSGAWIYYKKDGWRSLMDENEIVTALVDAPDGALLLSCSRGLLRSTDGGNRWMTVVEGEAGLVTQITFRPNGFGWAGSSDGTRFMRTRDHGKHWEELPVPFGTLPLSALQASPRDLFAATHDPKRMSVQFWHAEDEGLEWKRGMEARTSWPVVASLGHPPLLTLGGMLLVLQPNGSWTQHQIPGGGGIRRVASSGRLLLVLSTSGLYRSSDRGTTWDAVPDCPPHFEIVDIALTADDMYLLLTGGRVWQRRKEL